MPGDINQAIYDAGAFVNNKIKDVEVATGMVKQPRYVQPSQGNAYLGSEDIGNRMQQAGLVSSERRPMTELAASFISPSAVAKTAINAPKTAMNMLRMAENLEAPSRGVRNAQGMYIPRGQMGAIENLFHGSPHTFDRFDLSKMGTGEGAQAYGHGAYLAEAPEVAQGYADKLAFKRPDAINSKVDEVVDDLNYHNGSIDAVRGRYQGMIDSGNPDSARYGKEKMDLLDTVVSQEKKSNLYQTRLAWPDADREATDPLSPENFLDWDKTLAEQSPEVQNAVKSLIGKDWDETVKNYPELSINGLPSGWAKTSGENILGAVYERLGLSPSGTSQSLRDSGIPGIRYLDAGSRGAGESSRNYVVFDDKLIDIVSRNNQPIRKAEAPQAKALREAQINAAKPVSEGGLGLRPDNTPEERAMAMGFDIPAYHGTMNPVLNVDVGQARKFRNSETPIETALVSSSSPDVASTYAVSHGNKLNEWDTGIVQPLLINRGKNLRMNAGGREWSDLPYVEYSDSLEFPGGSTNNFASFANKLGYDSATIENVDDVGPGYELFRPWDSRSSVVFSFDPRNIRSRFAAFDPMRRDSPDLLAGIALPVVAAPVVSESNKKKRKDKKK
jgi:hypothetical protein